MRINSQILISVISDHVEFIRYLQKTNVAKISVVPISVSRSNDFGEFPMPLVYEGSVIDCVLVYAHHGSTWRQNSFGSEWVRQFRLSGYSTPVLLLGWIPPLRALTNQHLINPFITPFCKASCRILQLPSKVEKIARSINQLNHIDKEKWNFCKMWASRIALQHSLTRITLMSSFIDAKARLRVMSANPLFDIYSVFINDLLLIPNFNDLKLAIDKQLLQELGRNLYG